MKQKYSIFQRDRLEDGYSQTIERSETLTLRNTTLNDQSAREINTIVSMEEDDNIYNPDVISHFAGSMYTRHSICDSIN